MSVVKTFTFDTGHRLSNYEGKCKQLHGHTYKCEIEVFSEYLDDRGMEIDFTELKEIFNEVVDQRFDHKFLLKKGDPINEALAEALPKTDRSIVWVDYNPTAENIARDIFEMVKGELPRERGLKILEVRLWETPTSLAIVNEGSFNRNMVFNEDGFDGIPLNSEWRFYKENEIEARNLPFTQIRHIAVNELGADNTFTNEEIYDFLLSRRYKLEKIS